MTTYVGLSGTLLSGKGTVIAIIKKNFKTYSISHSDILRWDLADKGIEITRDSLREYANELRKQNGADILAKGAVRYAEKNASDADVVIFDSVRTVAEVEYYRQRYGKNFKLLFIDAPIEIRYERAFKRKREGETSVSFEQFKAQEEKESGKSGEKHVQQLMVCKELADHVIINDGSVQELEEKMMQILR